MIRKRTPKSLSELLRRGETAATMVEYAVLVAFISIICIAGIRSFTDAVHREYSQIDSTLNPHFE